MVKSVAEKLGQIQKKHIKDFVVADYVSEFKFGLVEVVYEWARGMVSHVLSIISLLSFGSYHRIIQTGYLYE